MKIARTLLLVAVASGTLVGLAGGADADRQITFYGAGWGHGVGLSQWGAYGLARDGWGPRRILTHFYSGTRVGRTSSRPDKIRVGIAQGRSRVHLGAQSGKVGIRIGSVRGWRIGRIPSGYTWTVGVHGGRYNVRDSKGRLVGGHPWGGPNVNLYVRYTADHAVVGVPEAGHRYGSGWIEIGQARCRCSLRLVVVIPPERYLYGISEVPGDWPMAALEAQAVAARTYAFERVARLGQHREGCDCGLWSSTADQVYGGWDREGSSDGARWRAAVRHTRGHVVLYRGRPIEAFYHSSSGGHTESNSNVWGGAQVPYLRGVCDPGDYTAANPNRAWSVTLSGSTVGRRLAAATGHHIGAVRRFDDTARTQAGRVLATTAVGVDGRVRISGDTLDSALGLRDNKVWFDTNRNVRFPFRHKYDGLGCGPGLPASAQSRVPGGRLQRFDHGTMYRNAKRARTVWLHGPVQQVYLSHRESAGVLGMPRTDVQRLRKLPGCSAVRCVRALFENGGVFSKPGPGAHAVFGRVFSAYMHHGGTWHLGFPTSSVRRAHDGSRFATFEQGTIRCAHEHCRIRR